MIEGKLSKKTYILNDYYLFLMTILGNYNKIETPLLYRIKIETKNKPFCNMLPNMKLMKDLISIV